MGDLLGNEGVSTEGEYSFPASQNNISPKILDEA
jgi:hypothetical protein